MDHRRLLWHHGSLHAAGARALLWGLLLTVGVLLSPQAVLAEVKTRGEAVVFKQPGGGELELLLRARVGAGPMTGTGAAGGPKSQGAAAGAASLEAPTTMPPIRVFPLTLWRTTSSGDLVGEVSGAPTGIVLHVRIHTDGEDRYSLHLEATSKIPAWVGLLSLEMEAMATQAWLGGRDLKPVRLGKAAAMSGLDPKWVMLRPGSDTWSVLVDDDADGLKVVRSGGRLLLQADLLSAEARPFAHFVNCTDNWRSPNHRVALPVRQLAEGETLKLQVSLYAGEAVPLFKARYPDGRSAAFVITDHADQTAAPTLRALAGGTSNTNDPQWGKGGLLGAGIQITKALWMSSGEPAPAPLWSGPAVAAVASAAATRPAATASVAKAAVPAKSSRPGKPGKTMMAFRVAYERPQVDPSGGGRPQLDDPEVADLAALLYKLGWEMSPHSATPQRDERDRTEEALQFFDRYRARTWIDHQPYTNCEALINRGWRSGPFGIVDLLVKHGYGYAWSGIDVPPSSTLNLLLPKRVDHYNPVLWPAGRLWPGMPASLWLFSTMMTYIDSAKFFALYKKTTLDKLERERGLHIAHTYLEAFHPPGSLFARRNLMVPGKKPGEIVTHPKLEQFFALINERVKRGTLWAPTMERLGDYSRAMARVTVRLQSDGSALLRADQELTGATFVIPEPKLQVLINGQPAKGTSGSKTETVFWTDLPEGRAVKVELRDEKNQLVSLLRHKPPKSLLAAVPQLAAARH